MYKKFSLPSHKNLLPTTDQVPAIYGSTTHSTPTVAVQWAPLACTHNFNSFTSYELLSRYVFQMILAWLW